MLSAFLQYPQKLRYLLVGGANTLCGYLIFVTLYAMLNKIIHYNIILFIQYVININISYFTMKFFVFETIGNYFREYIKSYIVYIFIFFLNAVLLYCSQQIDLNVYLAQFLSVIILSIVIYILHKTVTYK